MNKYLKPIADFIENNDLSIDDTDFICLQYDIVEKMEKDRVGFEITQDIFELMENHPLVGFGAPGPLTHFIECFYNENQEQYKDVLKKSVKEKPTIHTVWLLNRVINGSEKPTELIEIMKSICDNENLHKEIRDVAKFFLE